MRGLWLENRHLAYREDLPLPKLEPGYALIRMNLAGVCSTDLEMQKGYYPFSNIPGHEFVGEVLEAPGNPAWVGKRVVGEISIYCGKCPTCLAGRTSHCEQRRTLGIMDYPGVFAEYLALPIINLHLVPAVVNDESAVFTELIAAAMQIQQQVHIQPGMRVLVVGAGRLGMLIAMTLSLTGCDLSVVVRRDAPAQILAGLHIPTLLAGQVKTAAYDLVIEVTGSPDGFALSRSAVRPRGTLVLKSTFAGDLTQNMSSIVVDEITLVGSRCGPFAPALRLLAAQQLNPQILIDSVFPLSDGLQAFERSAQPGVLKVLLKP